MKLTVKTLKGGKFEVQVDDGNTVSQVKGVIEAAKSELPAEHMKLIHSGKVLKDDDIISTVGIKPNDFLVVMVTKPKKPAAAAAPAAAVPAAAADVPKTPAPASATAAASTTATTTTTDTATATTTPAPTATGTTTAAAPPAAPAQAAATFPPEVIGNLTAMGFPEEEVVHCLRAAQGNPDMAVEFLTNGIPDGVMAAAAAAAASSSSPSAGSGGSSGASSSSSGGQTLQALRNHPQFNDLRRLVQSNPQMLQNVLQQIGQQQPELLREINANQELFLQMMNEPVTAGSGPSGGGGGQRLGGGGGGGNPLSSPAQMAHMIQSMSAEELQQMSAMMGLTPDQLRATAHMIGQLPPEQLQQFMMQAMGGGGMGGGGPSAAEMAAMLGGGGGGEGAPQVLRLTDEEMAAVDRLTEMGFDRAEAAQAFLACDKNEALAANLLMDSMGDDGGFGFGGGGGGGGSGGGGSGSGGNDGGGASGNGDNNDNSGDSGGGGGDDNDEDMYD